MPDTISIDLEAFNNDALVDDRVAAVDVAARGALRTALNYLYKDDGPINLPRGRLLTVEPHLDLAEKIVIRWLYTRTNGSLRKNLRCGCATSSSFKPISVRGLWIL